MVGVGALSGILALLLFNIGIIVKMVSENFEAIDAGPLEAGRAAGGTLVQINRAIATADALPVFINLTLRMYSNSRCVPRPCSVSSAGADSDFSSSPCAPSIAMTSCR